MQNFSAYLSLFCSLFPAKLFHVCVCCCSRAITAGVPVSFAAEPAEGADTLVFYGTDRFWPFFPIVSANVYIFIYVIIIDENVGKCLCTGSSVTVGKS